MIREALTRMLIGLKEGRETFIPDLIMLDGGKGHLTCEGGAGTRRFEGTELIALANASKRFIRRKQLKKFFCRATVPPYTCFKRFVTKPIVLLLLITASQGKIPDAIAS